MNHASPNRGEWHCTHFRDLSPDDLHDIMALRAAVFVVEQRCAYQDPDGADKVSHHLWCRGSNGEMIAYLRIVPPGISYTEPSLGRIITSASARGMGLGRDLVREGIAQLQRQYGVCPIRIGAQRYLVKFYERLGFARTGHDYYEDAIAHSEMLRGPELPEGRKGQGAR
ncbi:MAG: GNAT family N-acetyltransferase [Gemmatimonadota bacterium]|nr:GNAT family N-acetyltransferase [Gemmatimonadota bacterium]